MTKWPKDILDIADDHVHKEALRILLDELNEGDDQPQQDRTLELSSVLLSSCTPAVMFERCSGDYALVRNVDELVVGRSELRKPLFLGRVANVDEVYAMFAEFGLMQEDSKQKVPVAHSQP